MLNSRIHDMAKELGKTCIYKFAFVEQCETMKAPGQERARPFGGALCPGAFIVIVLRLCLQLRSLILRQEVGHAL